MEEDGSGVFEEGRGFTEELGGEVESPCFHVYDYPDGPFLSQLELCEMDVPQNEPETVVAGASFTSEQREKVDTFDDNFGVLTGMQGGIDFKEEPAVEVERGGTPPSIKEDVEESTQAASELPPAEDLSDAPLRPTADFRNASIDSQKQGSMDGAAQPSQAEYFADLIIIPGVTGPLLPKHGLSSAPPSARKTKKHKLQENLPLASNHGYFLRSRRNPRSPQ